MSTSATKQCRDGHSSLTPIIASRELEHNLSNRNFQDMPQSAKDLKRLLRGERFVPDSEPDLTKPVPAWDGSYPPPLRLVTVLERMLTARGESKYRAYKLAYALLRVIKFKSGDAWKPLPLRSPEMIERDFKRILRAFNALALTPKRKPLVRLPVCIPVRILADVSCEELSEWLQHRGCLKRGYEHACAEELIAARDAGGSDLAVQRRINKILRTYPPAPPHCMECDVDLPEDVYPRLCDTCRPLYVKVWVPGAITRNNVSFTTWMRRDEFEAQGVARFACDREDEHTREYWR